MNKESSADMAKLASDILAERIRPTKAQVKAIAACVVVQAHPKHKPAARKTKTRTKKPSKPEPKAAN